MNEKVIFRAEGIVKAFYGNTVLDHVQIELKEGVVHALCGENGAGKSTLLKIITGLYSKDAGSIYLDGKEVTINSVADAHKYGIYVVPQEMQILRELTVAENIFIGNLPKTRLGTIDWKTLYKKADQVKNMLGRHGERLDVHAIAGDLGVGAWQLIEIMRAFIGGGIRVIAFDEPTAALSDSEAESLFALIEQLKEQGIAVVYVSHRLKEVFRICDEVSIYRDGKYIGTREIVNTSNEELINMMVGRDVDLKAGRKNTADYDVVAIEAKNFSHGKFYHDVNLKVHKGEILGLYGLVGAGRTEFVRGLFGVDPRDSGTVEIYGKEVHIHTPGQAIRAGIGFVSENRREEGLVLEESLKKNLSVANIKAILNKAGNITAKLEKSYAEKGMKLFRVKAPNYEVNASSLSGGNQQKVVLAKWVMADCDVLIVDEPTRGIDVGAKAEVYVALRQLASEGKAIIMISSELPEILNVSDRIMVMCEGHVTAEMMNENLKEDDVIGYAFATNDGE